MNIKAVMLDPARMIFKHGWYARWLEDYARWGYNALALNLADMTGTALEFHSHPDLCFTPHAFSQQEMRRLIRAAGGLGLTVIPMLNSLGHTGWIQYHQTYRPLVDWNKTGRSVLCPTHPGTRALLTDLMEEILDVFPSRWIHTGLDESGCLPDPDCPRCIARYGKVIRPMWREEPFLDHVVWLNDFLKARGRRMMIWNDYIVGNFRRNLKNTEERVVYQGALIDQLPKDIIITDWMNEADLFRQKGFDVIDTGYVLNLDDLATWETAHGSMLSPTRPILDSIGAAIAARRRAPHPERQAGFWTCWWQDPATLFGLVFYGIAWIGDRLQHPGETPDFAAQFARQYFGLRAAAARRVGQWLDILYDCSPRFKRAQFLFALEAADVAKLAACDIQYGLDIAAQAQQAAAGLRKDRASVTRNREIYNAHILAAEMTADIGGRGRLFQEAAEILARRRADTSGEAQADYRRLARRLRTAASRARRLTERVMHNWDLGHFTDHMGRSTVTYPDALPIKDLEMGQQWYYNRPHAYNCYYDIQRSLWYLEKLAREAEGLAAGRRTTLSLPEQIPAKDLH